MKKVLSILLVVALVGVMFVSCSLKKGDVSALSYISLRINPEIELVADGNGEVIAVAAQNEDGEVLLADLELAGMSVEEASEAFTDAAIELGYLDPDSPDATVYADVESTEEEASSKLLEKLTDRINRYFYNHGIYGRVAPETLEKYATEAADWGVSVGHAKMVMRILDLYPEMIAEEVLALSVKDRIGLIQNLSKKGNIAKELHSSFKDAVKAYQEENAQMFALRAEIDALKVQLADTTLTAEVRAELEQQLSAKETQYSELYASYKEGLKTIRDEFRTKTETVKAEQKAKRQALAEEHRAEVEAREEKVKQNAKEIKGKIRDWRKGQQP